MISHGDRFGHGGYVSTQSRRNRLDDLLRHDNLLGIRAVQMDTQHSELGAVVVVSRETRFALTTGQHRAGRDQIALLEFRAGIALGNPSRELMAWSDGIASEGVLAMQDGHVRSADASIFDANSDFTWMSFRRRNVLNFKYMGFENTQCFHRLTSLG